MMQRILKHGRLASAIVAGGLVAGLATVGRLKASDHQDTPEVELSPRYDVNDVYVFPAATPGRTVLVLGTSSPLTPAKTPSFTFGTKDQELYQIKVDNTGDAVEDLVFQITFTGTAGHQRVTLHGPVKPNTTGPTNTLVGGKKTVSGPVNTVLGSSDGVQLFAGPRDDPFFIDLEQFFRILPDRKPSTGTLSALPDTATAGSFRSAAAAVDFTKGFNVLSIVVELPTAMLTAGGSAKLGIWGTISR